ncbi:hypothetical protein GCM10007036_21300 [Alsobacter metallidurans]|uniref:Adenylylsulfate kinase n=2 Tax=Alsobacter metallidurans TaxID=340221 RepID=A0A917I7D2_9HYPH|nr:hypothetical protein GCM10007036_21300 [Alsobacter metallidurans]
MGLPGSGKTTLANALAPRLNAVHFNADAVRQEINKDLGFSVGDRIEQARRMGWLCDQVVKAGGYAIADFVCPTAGAREAFQVGGDATIVWLDRISKSRYADTNQLFEAPHPHHVRVSADGTPEHWAEVIVRMLRPVFDPQKPTALFVGRYQPFHEGHRRLIEEGLRRVGQVCIAVRATHGTSIKDPHDFEYIRARIEHGLRAYEGRFVVMPVPNVSHIFYGRDVGYQIERLELDAVTEAISATQIRLREATRSPLECFLGNA